MKDIDYLYEIITDPLDDDEIISYLISNADRGYDCLVIRCGYEKRKIARSFNNDDYYNDWFMYQYNLFKNCILNASDKELEEFGRKHFEVDFVKLKKEFQTLPEIKNVKEFEELIKNKNLLIYKSSGYIEHEAKGWIYCVSQNVNLDKNKIDPKDITHRLYVSVEDYKALLFVKRFIQKCIRDNVPYMLKTPRFVAFRDDNIVVYTNDEWLKQHVLLLIETIKESKDIVFFKPPVLTGVISDYIGYGSEPVLKGESFNTKRKYFLDMIKSIAVDYYDKNKDKKYSYEGDLLSLQEINQKTKSDFSKKYISEEVLKVISNDMELIKIVREKLKESLFAHGICDKSYFDVAILNYKYCDDGYKKDKEYKI